MNGNEIIYPALNLTKDEILQADRLFHLFLHKAKEADWGSDYEMVAVGMIWKDGFIKGQESKKEEGNRE